MNNFTNEVLKNILTRRSVRDFSDKPVSKEDIETLITAARYAPSGMNKQTWKFTAILNKDLIHEFEVATGKACGRENYSFFGTPAIIIPTNERDSKWNKEDNACAMQNIALAAHSMGIGSVWINQMQGTCDTEEIRALLDKVNIPKNHLVFGLMALGYSKSEPKGQVEKKGQFEIIE